MLGRRGLPAGGRFALALEKAEKLPSTRVIKGQTRVFIQSDTGSAGQDSEE
jgi:hypothetical protein